MVHSNPGNLGTNGEGNDQRARSFGALGPGFGRPTAVTVKPLYLLGSMSFFDYSRIANSLAWSGGMHGEVVV